VSQIDYSSPYPITDEQVRFYQQNGYIQLFNVLSEAELERLRADIADAMEDRRKKSEGHNAGNPFYKKVFTQEVNLWTSHDGVARYTLSKRIGEIARRLCGVPKMRLWHDHALFKPAKDSLASDWHQDWPYWPMNHVGALSCWMALDDVNMENGCLQFVPGSHKWGVFPAVALGSGRKELEKMLFPDERENFKPVAMPMPAGSCTFHDGLTFHYANANHSDKPRRAIATIYQPDGTTHRKKGHCVTDPLDLADGAVLAHEVLPVVAEGPAFETTTFHDARPTLERAKQVNPKREAMAKQ